MDSTQFNLRWNNHSFNIVQVFLEQLSSESLVDVTLSCQGQFLKAHKMVLSACSSYFQDLFNLHEAQHPVIILNGIKFHDLKLVVEFMYKGEARVLESELNGILAVAEALQVKGLSNVRDIHTQQSAVSPEICFPSVAINEDFASDFDADTFATDPLEVSCAGPESSKTGRKRKRVSENTKHDGSAKLQRSDAGSVPLEISRPKSIATKPSNNRATHSKGSSQKVSSPKGLGPKASSPNASLPKKSPSKSNMQPPNPSEGTAPATRETSPESRPHCSSEEHSPGGIAPLQSEFQSHSITSSKEPATVSGRKAVSKTPSKVYPSKKSTVKGDSKASKSSNCSATSSEQLDQGNDTTQATPQVQGVEDNDLATTIKVEPLFIRDIDDNDTSWDDPTRLVIDLPPEDSENKLDESESPSSKGNSENSQIVVNRPKGKNVAKAQLKVRSVSEIIASREALTAQDPLSLEENVRTVVELPKERLSGKGDRIPRPPNAFMIFANEWRKKLALQNPNESNKQISVRLGLKWKGLNPEKKEEYFCAARRADEEHKRKYPGYFYSPKEARLRKAMRHQQRTNTVQQAKNSQEPNAPNPTFYIASLPDASLIVKEELLDEDAPPQNLEEEFLKMVEDGQVDAEVENEKKEQNCDTEASLDNQT